MKSAAETRRLDVRHETRCTGSRIDVDAARLTVVRRPLASPLSQPTVELFEGDALRTPSAGGRRSAGAGAGARRPASTPRSEPGAVRRPNGGRRLRARLPLIVGGDALLHRAALSLVAGGRRRLQLQLTPDALQPTLSQQQALQRAFVVASQLQQRHCQLLLHRLVALTSCLRTPTVHGVRRRRNRRRRRLEFLLALRMPCCTGCLISE